MISVVNELYYYVKHNSQLTYHRLHEDLVYLDGKPLKIELYLPTWHYFHPLTHILPVPMRFRLHDIF